MSAARGYPSSMTVSSDSISESLHVVFRALVEGESTSEEYVRMGGGVDVSISKSDGSPSLSTTGDKYDAELRAILQGYQSHVSGIEDHEKHLVNEMEQARENERLMDFERDNSYTELHREVGLPMQRSLFRMSPTFLEKFQLVSPYSLVSDQEQSDLERRTMPHRAHLKGSESNVGRMTKVQAVRKSEIQHNLSVASVKVLERKSASVVPVPAAPSSQMTTSSFKMGSDQWDEEMRVLKSMSSKLSFLKNPRHENEAQTAISSQMRKERKKSDRVGKLENMRITCDPEIVSFKEYDVGLIYRVHVELRNNCSLSKRIGILPPSTKIFSISDIKYPRGLKGGLIAPGMTVEFSVSFSPDNLGNFNDSIRVFTDGLGSFDIPLVAAREPPSLTLPGVLDSRYCFVGLEKTVHFLCKNVGGPGRFRLVSESDWPEHETVIEGKDNSILVGDCFSVSPADFQLGPGEECTFCVSFRPKEFQQIVDAFRIVCDNCQVMKYSLAGIGANLVVNLQEIDGFQRKDDSFAYNMWFKNVIPGSVHVRQIIVHNDSKLPVPFVWNILHKNELYSEEFSIVPADGVLPASADVSFYLTFSPQKIVLMDTQIALLAEKGDGSEHSSVSRGEKMFEMNVVGEGIAPIIHVYPPLLNFPGDVLIGTTCSTSFCLSHEYDCDVNFTVCNIPDELIVKFVRGSVPCGDDGLTVHVSFSPSCIGVFESEFLLLIENGRRIPIPVRAQVCGPLIDFECERIDFGLVRSETKISKEVVISNKSACPARYRLDFSDGKRLYTGPFSGCVPPFSCESVEICMPASAPGSISDVLRLISTVDGSSKYLFVKAECQAPECSLAPSIVDIGCHNVGEHIEGSKITMSNMTLLPATFHWPSVSSDSFDAVFTPSSGTIGPGGSIDIFMNFRGKTSGNVNSVITCTVDGMESPLGFVLQCTLLGLAVEYSVSNAGDIRVLSSNDAGGTGARIDFGRQCPIRERRFETLTISNTSGTRSDVELSFENFPASIMQGIFTETRNNKTEAEGTFSSADGKAIYQKLKDDEIDRAALSSGRWGVAFAFETDAGLQDACVIPLLPYSSISVRIVVFSDMCGLYADNILCVAGDLEPRKIPISIGIIGSPISLRRDRIVQRGSKKFDEDLSLLHFGSDFYGGTMKEKTFYALNRSPFDINIQWRVLNIPTDPWTNYPELDQYSQNFLQEGPHAYIADSMAIDSKDDVLRLVSFNSSPKSYQNGCGLIDVEPYSIEPEFCTIRSGESQCFTVKYDDGGNPGKWHANICGKQSVVSQGNVNSILRQGSLTPFCSDPYGGLKDLMISVQGDSIVPSLEIEGRSLVKFYVQSVHSESSHDSFKRKVTISNILPCAVSFTMRTSGPFYVSDINGAPQGSSMIPTLSLQPQQTCTVCLAMGVGGEINPALGDSATTLTGDLSLLFTNGAAQKVLLSGKVVYPTLLCSSERISFGKVAVGTTTVRTLVATNNSPVEARWSLKISGDKLDHGFVVEPSSGVIPGFATGRPNSIEVAILYTPKSEGKHTVELEWTVFKGSGPAPLAADGEGAFDEIFERKIFV